MHLSVVHDGGADPRHDLDTVDQHARAGVYIDGRIGRVVVGLVVLGLVVVEEKGLDLGFGQAVPALWAADALALPLQRRCVLRHARPAENMAAADHLRPSAPRGPQTDGTVGHWTRRRATHDAQVLEARQVALDHDAAARDEQLGSVATGGVDDAHEARRAPFRQF